jgi:hypothetical protein
MACRTESSRGDSPCAASLVAQQWAACALEGREAKHAPPGRVFDLGCGQLVQDSPDVASSASSAST